MEQDATWSNALLSTIISRSGIMLPLKVSALYRKIQKLLDRTLPEPLFYQRRYFLLHKRFCNFRKPRRFSEKIFHRMRYPAPVFSLLADKVRAREYIERTIGAEYLVPCYLVCDRVTTQTLEGLPDSFVMKANHSSRQTRIVTDKSHEDPEVLARIANDWLRKDFSRQAREKHYSDIQPKIIFEKALLCNGKPPDDYKFNIFNGGPGNRPYVFIQVMQGRFEKKTDAKPVSRRLVDRPLQSDPEGPQRRPATIGQPSGTAGNARHREKAVGPLRLPAGGLLPARRKDLCRRTDHHPRRRRLPLPAARMGSDPGQQVRLARETAAGLAIRKTLDLP